MTNRLQPFPACLTAAWVVAGTSLSAGQLTPLSPLTPDGLGTTTADDISADGSLIAGSAENAFGGRFAVIWGSGRQEVLPILEPRVRTYPSNAYALSRDGTTAVGYAYRQLPNATRPSQRAVRWTATGIEDLGTLGNSPEQWAEARAVSRDGSYVVGVNFGVPGPSGTDRFFRAFRWHNGMMQDLGTLSPGGIGRSSAWDISDDGQVVVGYSTVDVCPGTGIARCRYQAFLWTPSGGMQSLDSLGGRLTHDSAAQAVSADGAVVAGVANNGSRDRAFRWTQVTGMVDLGTPAQLATDSAAAFGISANGAHIVGRSRVHFGDGGSTLQAVMWSGGEILVLGSLQSDGKGYSLASAVSDDGTVVVGGGINDDGDHRGFIWKRDTDPGDGSGPGDGGTMLDHINTLTQVARSGAQQAAAAAIVGETAEFVLDQEIAAPRPEAVLTRLSTKGADHARPPVAVRLSAAGAHNADSVDIITGGLTVAAALTPGLTLGGYLGVGEQTNDLTGFDMDGRFSSFGVYLRGRREGDTGLTWKLAVAQHAGDVEITRPADLANTESGVGDSRLTGRTGAVELGYGLDRGALRLSPFVRLRHTETRRDGYTENDDAAFPVTYDTHRQEATVAILGLDSEYWLAPTDLVQFSGGIEHDLHRSERPISGSSEIPGMGTIRVDSPEIVHGNRLFASARYTRFLRHGGAIDVSLGVRQSVYTDTATVLGGVGYQVRF